MLPFSFHDAVVEFIFYAAEGTEATGFLSINLSCKVKAGRGYVNRREGNETGIRGEGVSAFLRKPRSAVKGRGQGHVNCSLVFYATYTVHSVVLCPVVSDTNQSRKH